VAAVVDGVENAKQAAWANLNPAVILNIQRQPGANIIAVVDRVKKLLPQLRAASPRRRSGGYPHRPHDHHSRVRPGCAVHAGTHRSARRHGDFFFSSAASAPRSFPASLFRFL